MSSWIDKYKSLVISSHKRHIIVADLDNLFGYPELKQAFEYEGYIVLNAKTGLDVRVLFELKIRDSESYFLVIVPESYNPLPDIEEKVNYKAIGLPQLFPNLDAKAIKGLSFNALSVLSNIKLYEELSHEKTLKFLLENLYNVDFETLTSSRAKERVLNALIAVLLEKNGINQSLSKFLVGVAKPYFTVLISNGLNNINLISFIQNQWKDFVEKSASEIDFTEPVLLKSLGYLFTFEYLKPVKVSAEKYKAFPKSLKIGVFVDEQGNNDNELEALIEYLNQELNGIEDLVDQWFKIIHLLAGAKLKSLLSKNESLKEQYNKIENSYNYRFQRFIDNIYNSLFTLSGVRRPVVVSRLLEYIKANPSNKKALLVIDGMNYWQWKILGSYLSDAGITYSPGATLAFIPTITAWSRQAIFKGDKPDLNADNSKEGVLFDSFWQKHGILPYQIFFQKFSVNEPLSVDTISNDIKVAGLVCNDLDDIMHGSVLGNLQLKTSTEQWITKSKIVQKIAELKGKGFQLYITSDHGNIEATGIRNLKIKDKVGTLSRGKRHLQFTNELLIEEFLQQNGDILAGRKSLSVYLKNKEAFTAENIQVITHGGSHFWEVIVPLIIINEQ